MGWFKPRETRRSASEAELTEFYAAASNDEWWDWGSFLLWDNPNFSALRWSRLGDRVIRDLPPAQRTLVVINVVDGQIGNGGVEQLFFNYVHDAKIIRDNVIAFGWSELTARFVQQYDGAFGSSMGRQIEKLNHAFQWSIFRGKPWGDSWQEFKKIYSAVDGDTLNDWFYEAETRREFNRQVLQFIQRHSAELLVVREES